MDKNKIVPWSIVVLIAALISVFVLFAPANAGVSPDVGRSIGDVPNGTRAIIGETNLIFVDSTGVLIPSGKLKGTWEDSKPIWFPNEGDVFDSSKAANLVDGEYNVIGDNGKTTTVDFEGPTFFQDVPTEVNGYDFEWVTRGGKITLNADTNLHEIRGPKPNDITYKLLDPRGVRVYEVNGVLLYDISVDGNGDNSLTINTTGMRTGTYTLSIETDPETNNGLDTEGPEKSFEVRSKGVRIVKPDPKIPEERTVTVTESMPFKFETTPKTNVTLDVTWGMPSEVYFEDPKSGKVVGGGRSDSKGILEINAVFEVTGSFEITATEDIMGTATSIFIESVPYEAELTEPKEEVHYIGVPITIAGKANAGDRVTIKIEDETFDIVERDGDTFEALADWQTDDKSPGSYKISIWVSPFSDPETDPPDDSVTIILIRGGLFVETSADFVALGDEFKIEGTVPGRDRVDILTIAPDGGGGSGFDPDDITDETEERLDAPGLTYATSGVGTDHEFETENIAVSKDVDTGTYLIAALNYGRDGIWGRSRNDNLLEVISNNYAMDLGVKTTDQILAVLIDRTINAPGTDDLLGIATIKVEKGFVTLDEIEAVPLGKKIAISGTTNRQVDTSIIVTVEGLDEKTPNLKPKIAKVKEDPDNFYNKFEISFATASANIGEYEVTADDGDGHIDTTTVNILLAVEPSVNVSATSTPIVEPEGKGESEGAAAATPLQTPTPTAIEEPETEKQPGFGAVFSIAVLLVVTWLMLRTRQRQQKDKKQ